MIDIRLLVSFVVGLLLCIGIWVAVPYNNFALNNSFISDSYLPEVLVLSFAGLVLVVNPLLRRYLPGAVLERRHLLLICIMMMFAAILPSNGLLRFFPHSLVAKVVEINNSPRFAPAIAESDLPASLFPDPIELDNESDVSRQFIDELDAGNSIPWGAWVPPLIAWGTLIVAFWVLMIGMGLAVFPQWMNVERLTFPLLRIYQAFLTPAQDNHSLPPVFRSRLFWVGCGSVFAIHSLNGLSVFTQGGFPSFPLSWNLSPVLTEGIWLYLPGFLKSSRIYFVFVGLAFFMPKRYSFSIWFTVLCGGLFVMYTRMYAPTFNTGVVYDYGGGAVIAMAIGILWLGRVHYKRVLLASIGIKQSALEHDGSIMGGRMFLAGAIIMFGWFIWAGVEPGWAFWFVLSAVIIMLIVTRIVAETGLVYVWIIPFTARRIVELFPTKWVSVPTAFMDSVHYLLVNRASAISAAAIMVLSLGLKPSATPRQRGQIAGLGAFVLVVGLLVCGAVHLGMTYHMPTSVDGKNTPVVGRGAHLLSLGEVDMVISGRERGFDWPKAQNIFTGCLVAGVLLFLCGRYPAWPLHPIGMIFWYSSIGLRLFMSLFIGWLIKTLLIQIFGARAYHIALPLFLGLIVGEILANAIWTLVPAVQLLMGADPSTIQRMIIFQYT